MIGLQPGSLRSALFVIFQIALTILIFISGVNYPSNYFLLIAYILFFILALWAMYIMKFRFNISPDPLTGIRLISQGPYRLIRHPMYTSLLGITVCLIIDDFSVTRLIYWLLLAVNMLFKLTYEEKLMTAKFPEYREYSERTKRLIPFIL